MNSGITGHIKTNFSVSESFNKTMTCGIASITNGTYKVNVQVANFDKCDLRKGQKVTITGSLKKSDDGNCELRMILINFYL